MSKFQDEGGVATESKASEKLERPKLYSVILHNDNYTSMEFVVDVLRAIFYRSAAEAEQIMMEVHKKGRGVAGTYPREIAEMKLKKTEIAAREREYPLHLTMEPEAE